MHIGKEREAMGTSSPIETIQTLGKYILLEKIGEGYLGSVFRGFDQDLGRAIAVRILCDGIKWDAAIEKVYFSQCKAVAGLRHENIASVLDFGTEGGRRYIVLESLGNSTLKTLIAQRPVWTIEAKLSLMIQIAEGLSYAHKRGILHRDLGPAKIHLTADGKVKIRDFAIASVLLKHLPHPWIRFGTPIYLSPEQIQQKKPDPRSDLFAAGTIFYELITYHHPFHDRDSNKALDNILQDGQIPTFERFPDEPPGIWPILKTCLERNPDDRYQSMEELISACRTLQKDLAEDSRLMLSELCSALAPLRAAAAKPGASASIGTLLQDIERLLRGEKEPDYVSLDRLMNKLLEQYPALQAVSGSLSTIDSSAHELLTERMGLGLPEAPGFSQNQTGTEMQAPAPADPEPAPREASIIKPEAAPPDWTHIPLKDSIEAPKSEKPSEDSVKNLCDFPSEIQPVLDTSLAAAAASHPSASLHRQPAASSMDSIRLEGNARKDLLPDPDLTAYPAEIKPETCLDIEFSAAGKPGPATCYRRIRRNACRAAAVLLAFLLTAAAVYIALGTDIAAALTDALKARMPDSGVFASAFVHRSDKAPSPVPPAAGPNAPKAAPGMQTPISSVAEIRQQPVLEIKARASNQPPKEHAARIAALMNAGQLSYVKTESDNLQPSHPASLQVRQPRRQWEPQNTGLAQESAGKKEETLKADLRRREEEWSRRLAAIMARGQYGEAAGVLNQWLADNPASAAAQDMGARISEIQRHLNIYASAMAENNYPEALTAIQSAEKLNPADSNFSELRRRIEYRRAAARSFLSVYRLGAKATILLDGRQAGYDGELENESLPIGPHTVAIESSGSPVASTRLEFPEGQRVQLVYDVAGRQIRSMAESDRELLAQRKAMEEVRYFDAEHDHGVFRGSCRGLLMIDPLDVAYRPSAGYHGFRIPFKLLKLQIKGNTANLINVSDNKTYQSFKFRDDQEAEKFRRSWDELKAFTRQ